METMFLPEDLTPLQIGESFGTWKILLLNLGSPSRWDWQEWVEMHRKAYKRRWDFDDAGRNHGKG